VLDRDIDAAPYLHVPSLDVRGVERRSGLNREVCRAWQIQSMPSAELSRADSPR
jgi:hypothetical protein